MKHIYSLFLVISVCLSSCSDETDTPKKLFTEIKIAAINSDKVRLNDLVYNINVPEENMHKEIVKGILKNKQSGDYAYSDEAIGILLDQHTEKFRVIGNSLYQKLFRHGPYSTDTEMSKIPFKDIFVFEKDQARIIIVRIENMYKLLFWENLNDLRTKDIE